MMNRHYALAVNSFLVVLGLISFNILASKISAQESIDSLDRPNIPLDDQVRFIGELESKNSNQWNFMEQGYLTANGESYLTVNSDQLQIAEPTIPVRLVEQDKPEWDHTGQAPKYSILFYLYGESSIEY